MSIPKQFAEVFSRTVESKLAEKKHIFEVHDRASEVLLLKKNRSLKLKPIILCYLLHYYD
jgi:hypothetical protein